MLGAYFTQERLALAAPEQAFFFPKKASFVKMNFLAFSWDLDLCVGLCRTVYHLWPYFKKFMKIAVYPGSFDPITNGHLDIIDRARRMFDKILVAVACNSSKQGLFSYEERREMIAEVTAPWDNVGVTHFDGLLIDFCKNENAIAVIRGLRAVSDFDYEYAMFQMNREFNTDVDTVFLLASGEYSYLSSSIIKEFARFGRSVSPYTPGPVNAALLKKFGHRQQ